MRHLLILLTALLGLATPALAYDDCAANTGRKVLGLLKGAETTATLVKHIDKANSDVYILLADIQTGISPVAKLSTFTAAIVVMNCAALEAANPAAGQLRVRWAQALGIKVSKLTSDRVQGAFRERLATSAKGENTLLSEAERQLIADTLSQTCTWEGHICPDTRRLADKLNLPTPSRAS
jgi:hypothetical protein